MPCSIGMVECRPDCRHRQMVYEYRVARHAAELEREAATGGYPAELDAYPEIITFRTWLEQTGGRDMAEHVAQVAVQRDSATFYAAGWTERTRLPWRRYATATVYGHDFDAAGLLDVVREWTSSLLPGAQVRVVPVEHEAMHGREEGTPADPFVKPARFHVTWL